MLTNQMTGGSGVVIPSESQLIALPYWVQDKIDYADLKNLTHIKRLEKVLSSNDIAVTIRMNLIMGFGFSDMLYDISKNDFSVLKQYMDLAKEITRSDLDSLFNAEAYGSPNDEDLEWRAKTCIDPDTALRSLDNNKLKVLTVDDVTWSTLTQPDAKGVALKTFADKLIAKYGYLMTIQCLPTDALNNYITN